ncbi:MAG: ATP-binding protein [Haloarculaceae archaeon]
MADTLDAVKLVYVGLPLLTIVVGHLVSHWIYTYHRDERGAKWFLLLQGFGLGWMLTTAAQFYVTDPGLQRTIGVIYGAFSFWALTTWVPFVSRYTGRDYHERPLGRAALAVGYLGYPLLALTNPWHHTLIAQWHRATQPFPYVWADLGVGFLVVFTVLTVAIGYSYYALIEYLLSTPRRSGAQLLSLILGALAIPLVQVLGDLGLFPAKHAMHAPYGSLPFVLLSALALFGFRFMDVQPVARNAVVEGLLDPVIVLDDERRVVDYNERVVELCGGITDGIGQPFAETCPRLADGVSLPTSGESAATQLTITVDGQERHYSVNVSAIGRSRAGGAEWYTILLRDVTELERSRWQLQRQNERLDQVAATISHDLRNPISVADGHVTVLADELSAADLDAETSARATDHLESARGAHERMEEIIDDVLTLAREGKTVEETEPLSLEAVARQAWETVATDGARLVIDGDRRLAADRGKLRTILENLFRNAVEHGASPDGGTEAPPAVTVTVGATAEGFAVADDGPGVPPGERERIFEYGYTTADGGTGLGLSIVRTMAESHGWTVGLDADYDGGTRFVFRDVAGEAAATEPAGEGVER